MKRHFTDTHAIDMNIAVDKLVSYFKQFGKK